MWWPVGWQRQRSRVIESSQPLHARPQAWMYGCLPWDAPPRPRDPPPSPFRPSASPPRPSNDSQALFPVKPPHRKGSSSDAPRCLVLHNQRPQPVYSRAPPTQHTTLARGAALRSLPPPAFPRARRKSPTPPPPREGEGRGGACAQAVTAAREREGGPAPRAPRRAALRWHPRQKAKILGRAPVPSTIPRCR